MGRRPLPKFKQDAILQELARGTTRGKTAKLFGVSEYAVRTLAIANGMTRQVQNNRLRLATDTHVLTTRARRAAQIVKLLDLQDGLLAELTAAHELIHYDGKLGEFVREPLTGPMPKDKKDLAIALGILFDKGLALEKYDAEGINAGKAAIIGLFEDLKRDTPPIPPESPA